MTTLGEHRQAHIDRQKRATTVQPPELKSGLWFIDCPVCRCGFFAKRKTAKYCSPECRQAAYRQRKATAKRYAPHEVHKCSHCNQVIEQPATGRPAKYCSASCRQAAYKWRLEV